nr:hypothetical protein [Maliibacterium massiliense]
MRLPVFELIDETLLLMEERNEAYHEAARELEAFFTELFDAQSDCVLNITTRVKSKESLREKILRNNLYKRHVTPEGILADLSDLIGLRVECRFLMEEEQLYQRLASFFSEPVRDDWHGNPAMPYLHMETGALQPQQQKNGFAIYRVDGVYEKEAFSIRFELQIKALVHVFWTEVEHQIIYKNNNYMLADTFMRELMGTTYNSLEVLDRQLYVLYRQMQHQMNNRSTLQEGELLQLLAKAISDFFSRKMQESLGFTLNFNRTCDILSRYIYERGVRYDQNQKPRGPLYYVFRSINAIAKSEIHFEQPIALEQPFVPEDTFSSILGGYMLRQINVDYEWNLFFRMLFTLEPGNNTEDFTAFLRVLRDRFSQPALLEPLAQRWQPQEVAVFQQEVLAGLAQYMADFGAIDIIYEDNLNAWSGRVRVLAEEVAASGICFEQWEREKERYLYKMNAM